MSQRVYSLITPEQKSDLERIGVKTDRSVSYLIARAIEQHIDNSDASSLTTKQATEKVFARTTAKEAARIKSAASRCDCHEWRVVNTAINLFLAANQ